MLEFEDIEKVDKKGNAVSDMADTDLIGSNLGQSSSCTTQNNPAPRKQQFTIYSGKLLFDTAYHKAGQTLQFIDAGINTLLQNHLHLWDGVKDKYLVSKDTVDTLQEIGLVERTVK